MEADKYAGIITVTAVVLAVIYADGDYDIWDAALGMLTIVLSFKYRSSIHRDKFAAFLSAFLFSLGLSVLLYTAVSFLPRSEMLSKLISWEYSVIDTQFIFVVILTLPLAVIWYRLSHNKS